MQTLISINLRPRKDLLVCSAPSPKGRTANKKGTLFVNGYIQLSGLHRLAGEQNAIVKCA
jgi:hypothetical protein